MLGLDTRSSKSTLAPSLHYAVNLALICCPGTPPNSPPVVAAPSSISHHCSASKGGVAQLTKALSNEWASKGINVNAVAPGYIDTDMNVALINDSNRNAGIMARIPAGRWGKPEDFKGPVVFLASQASGYVSGEVLCVDGGWLGR